MMNRRNAALGWAVWQIGKRVAKRKARAVLPGTEEGSRRPNTAAILLLVAAVGGALWLWWRGGEDDGWIEPDR